MINKNPVHKYIHCIIFIFIAMSAIGLIGSVSTDRTSGDFDVYYTTSQNYLAGIPIYTAHQGIEEFKYLPVFALFFSPLALINKVPALYIWSILNLGLFYGMFYFLYKLKQISFSSTRDLAIVVFLFALTGRYIFANIKIGQANMLLCFLMVMAMYFEIQKKDLLSALALAFSLMIKFFPLLLLGYFVIRRRFKIVGYTFLFIGFFLFLPAVYSGFSLNLKYIQEWFELLKATPANMLYSVKNYSLLSFFSWLFVSRHEGLFILDYRYITKGLTPQVYYAWVASCLSLFILFFYDSFFKKDKKPEEVYLDYACLFVCGLLFNPLAYLNALILLVIPYFFILRFIFYSPLSKKWRVMVGILAILCFISTMAYNKVFFKDIEQFYLFLKYRLPMWTVIMVYLTLWFIKLITVRQRHQLENLIK